MSKGYCHKQAEEYPICNDCGGLIVGNKTKAEEQLIKSILKHEEATTHADRGVSWDNVQKAILKVILERSKK